MDTSFGIEGTLRLRSGGMMWHTGNRDALRKRQGRICHALDSSCSLER